MIVSAGFRGSSGSDCSRVLLPYILLEHDGSEDVLEERGMITRRGVGRDNPATGWSSLAVVVAVVVVVLADDLRCGSSSAAAPPSLVKTLFTAEKKDRRDGALSVTALTSRFSDDNFLATALKKLSRACFESVVVIVVSRLLLLVLLLLLLLVNRSFRLLMLPIRSTVGVEPNAAVLIIFSIFSSC